MRLTVVCSAILGASLLTKDALAFVPSDRQYHGVAFSTFGVSDATTSRSQHVVVAMSKNKQKKKGGKKLSVADIMAGGNKQVEQDGPGEVKASDNFSEDILDDMKACLQKLEKRVKGGKGALNGDEVSDFEAAMARIVADMDGKLQQGASPKAAASSAPDVASKNVYASKPAVAAAKATPLPPPPPPPPHPPAAPQAKEPDDPHAPVVTDISLDEGPAYTGEGGMGMASGTRNTYVIPGMDEMTGEEYRKALQATISGRQEERRRSRSNVVGNRAAHSYLDDLGYGGASSSLAATNPTDAKSSDSDNLSSSASAIKSHNPFNGPAKTDASPSSQKQQPRPKTIDWSKPKYSQPDPVVSHRSGAPHRPPPEFEDPEMVEAHKITDKFVGDGGKAGEGEKSGAYGGMPSGTRNTYVIPGMDEMTGEEYRRALQQTVIDRQEERRKSRAGVVGNRAAHSYLDDLGYGGASASLAADSGED